MARSNRKPYCHNNCIDAGEQSAWKRAENKRFRAATKRALQILENRGEAVFPLFDKGLRNSPGDGRKYVTIELEAIREKVTRK